MMIFYVFIIWANDVFAYLVGMSVGRHRLCERLSPKKSWEGFFGGIAGAVVLGLVAARVMDGSCWVWAGLALVAAATGVLGDPGGVDVQARRRGQGFGNVDSRSRRSAGPLRRHAALGARSSSSICFL